MRLSRFLYQNQIKNNHNITKGLSEFDLIILVDIIIFIQNLIISFLLYNY